MNGSFRIVTGKKFKQMALKMIESFFIQYLHQLRENPHTNILKQWPKYLTRFCGVTVVVTYTLISLLLNFILSVFKLNSIDLLIFYIALHNHKDQDDQYEDDLLSIADPLNQVCTAECFICSMSALTCICIR